MNPEAAPGQGADAVVWDELLARTGEDSRLTVGYQIFLTIACLLAAIGAFTDSPVTVVGAMVLGPEFGPLAAVAVGMVLRRGDLIARGVIALAVGFPLAMAVTAVIPNADAAPPIVNATILPLLFLSGVFIPISADTPAWIDTVSNFFPVRHFADAMRAAYLGNVHVHGTTIRAFPFEWSDLAVIAVWGVVGLVLASRFFSWEPRK